MKVALVHDWVVDVGGAERALQVFHEIWPDAPLFTLVFREDSVRSLGFDVSQVRSSFLQRMPRATRWYRGYLPLYPLAVEQFDLSGFDVVFSSSHMAAKAVLVRGDQMHVCFCHTPSRYLWDMTHQYLKDNALDKGLKSLLARLLLHYLRIWDAHTANRVDHFLVHSDFIARRVWRTYRRQATIIPGNVDLERFRLSFDKREYFLFVSRLVQYKQPTLVIKAFNELGLPLVVVGSGPMLEQCRKLAGRTVDVRGYQPDEQVATLMAGARALVFAAEEDFGLVPLEAQACGTPVIAYGRGGVVDTVIPADGSNWDKATGVFFTRQEPDAIQGAVKAFLKYEHMFDPRVLRSNAERYGRGEFKRRVREFVENAWASHLRSTFLRSGDP